MPLPLQDPKPFFVHVAPPESPQHQLGRVIVGAFGLTGALVAAAIGVGVLLAAVWIVWRRVRRTYDVDAPPTLGAMPLSPRRDKTVD